MSSGGGGFDTCKTAPLLGFGEFLKRTTFLWSFFITNAFTMDLLSHSEKPENQAGQLRRFSDYSESHTLGSSAMRLRLGGRNDGILLSSPYGRGTKGEGAVLCCAADAVSPPQPSPIGEGAEFLPRLGEARRGSGLKAAFTLAEVLITLGIIGVVAAMTLPALTAKYKDKILVQQGKKVYSEVLNAIKLYMAKNECPDESCIFDTSKTTEWVNREMFKVFDGATYCENGNEKPICQKIMMKSNSKINNGYGQTGYGDNLSQPFLVLKSGAVVKFYVQSACIRTVDIREKDENGMYIFNDDGSIKTHTATTDNCGGVYIDSNGQKEPNQRGADFFTPTFTSKNKFVPDNYLKKLLSEDKINYTPYQVGVEY